MSRSIDLFIDSTLDLAHLAGRLGKLIGVAVSASPGGDGFDLCEGETVTHLGPHPFVDDGDLLFSRYPYVLSARIPTGQSVHHSAELALLRHVAELIGQHTSMTVLLVHDLQHRDKATGQPPAQLPAPAAPVVES